MRDQKEIDGAEEIIGAGQLEFFLLRQVAEVEETEAAIGDHHANGARIFSAVGGSRRLGGTIVVCLAGAGQWSLDRVSRGRNNANFEAFDGKSPSRLDHDMS